MIGGSGPGMKQCSRVGCAVPAQFNVNWRNPRIHGPERVKIWLACADHEEFLYAYLMSRGFPVLVTDLDSPASVVPDGESQ